MMPEQIAAMIADREAGTPGPWRYKALGGASTVLTVQRPARNDNRMPAYAYKEENGFCLSYPFIEDDGRTRWDFTCFSHADARRIARVPDMEATIIAQAAENAELKAGYEDAFARGASYGQKVMPKGTFTIADSPEIAQLRAERDALVKMMTEATRDIVTGETLNDDARPDLYVGDILAIISLKGCA